MADITKQIVYRGYCKPATSATRSLFPCVLQVVSTSAALLCELVTPDAEKALPLVGTEADESVQLIESLVTMLWEGRNSTAHYSGAYLLMKLSQSGPLARQKLLRCHSLLASSHSSCRLSTRSLGPPLASALY